MKVYCRLLISMFLLCVFFLLLNTPFFSLQNYQTHHTQWHAIFTRLYAIGCESTCVSHNTMAVDPGLDYCVLDLAVWVWMHYQNAFLRDCQQIPKMENLKSPSNPIYQSGLK